MTPPQIWKFPFPVQDQFRLTMPAGARILEVQVQNGQPVLWAIVSPDNPKESRPFILLGTGHPWHTGTPDEYDHLGTFQLVGGTLIFHLFELRRAPCLVLRMAPGTDVTDLKAASERLRAFRALVVSEDVEVFDGFGRRLPVPQVPPAAMDGGPA